MENTISNKAKFFALYWGFEFTGSDHYGEYMPDTWSEFPKYVDKQYLILKPLSSISDEDFNEVMCLIFPFQPRASFKKSGFYTDHLNINQADYLRSKGYALPWMGLSVESLIEYGWVKLKEPNNA